MGKLHNEELHDLHFTPAVIRTVKSRRKMWEGKCGRKRAEGKRMYVDGIARRIDTPEGPR
jgi:hypothetical protein